MLIGIDVAKAELVVGSRPGGERWTVANDERGVRSLVERLREEKPELIVLEATGGYELRRVATTSIPRSVVDACDSTLNPQLRRCLQTASMTSFSVSIFRSA